MYRQSSVKTRSNKKTSSNSTFHPFYISYPWLTMDNKNRAKVLKFIQRINKKYAFRLKKGHTLPTSKKERERECRENNQLFSRSMAQEPSMYAFQSI